MTPQQIARKRGLQTLADGALVVVIVAGIAPLVGAVGAADGWTAFLSGWQTWTWQIVQAATIAGGTAVVAWLRRRFLDPPETDPQHAIADSGS